MVGLTYSLLSLFCRFIIIISSLGHISLTGIVSAIPLRNFPFLTVSLIFFYNITCVVFPFHAHSTLSDDPPSVLLLGIVAIVVPSSSPYGLSFASHPTRSSNHPAVGLSNALLAFPPPSPLNSFLPNTHAMSPAACHTYNRDTLFQHTGSVRKGEASHNISWSFRLPFLSSRYFTLYLFYPPLPNHHHSLRVFLVLSLRLQPQLTPHSVIHFKIHFPVPPLFFVSPQNSQTAHRIHTPHLFLIISLTSC